jgi:hypothetical protein
METSHKQEFEYLQYCLKNNVLIENGKDFNANLTDEEFEKLVKNTISLNFEILREGGIIFNRDILDFNTFEDYMTHLKEKNAKRNKNVIDNWIKNRPARLFFVKRKPINKSEELLFDKYEECATIIEDYWDDTYFNQKELAKQLICICERNYGGENKIGILIKKEPYANQYIVVVRGIIGGYNVANTGDGWSLELESDAKRFSLSKSYRSFPTKDDLIDDFVNLDLFESQPPVDFIRTDIKTYPIYLTSKEYFI